MAKNSDIPQKHSTVKNQRKNRTTKTEALIIGLILAIVGSIVASSFEKGSLTNYAGFGMLLAGIAAVVVGTCSLVSGNIEARLRSEQPDLCRGKRRLPICTSIWAIGAGLILAVIGSMIASTYDRALLLNTVGFGMLLAGIGVSVLGLSSAALGTVRIELNRNKPSGNKTPRTLFFDIVSLGLGVVFLVIGTILAGSYAKETMLNDAGFMMLILGIAVLCLGASGTAVSMLKARFNPENDHEEAPPRMIFGSIWAIGIGTMLLIIGLILSGSYEKNSLMNYAGFGMLVSGAGVFVYGIFETAKASAMGLLNYRLARNSVGRVKRSEGNRQDSAGRVKFYWKNMVRTSAVFNLAGVISSVCILFFSIWQLDIIVSGPVWYANPDGSGWSWHGPGPYADEYFQCYLWKTTVGQAYDTLFMLMFIAFIVMFLSAYFWPKQDRNFTKSTVQEEPPRRERSVQSVVESQPEVAREQGQAASAEDEETEAHVDY